MKLIVIGLWIAWAIWGSWASHTDKPAIGLYVSGLVLAGVTCYTFNLVQAGPQVSYDYITKKIFVNLLTFAEF